MEQTPVPSRRNAQPSPWNRRSRRRSFRTTTRLTEAKEPGFRPDSYPRRQEFTAPVQASGIPVWKRGFDIGLILILLPLVLILALVIGCWIKAVSPGTVLFRQKRVGLGGKIFTMYKFRSMSPLADTSPHEAHVEHLIKSGRPMFKLDATGDRRLIKGGRTIRMAGLDELPQLINVLRGEMSLVGPRPCTSNEFALYNANQLDRFSVPPGLTGLWQIRRNASTTFRGMVDMDDEYVAGLSPWLDFKIVMATPAAIVGQLGRSARGMVAGRSAAGAEWTPRRTAMLHTAYLNGATGTQKLAD